MSDKKILLIDDDKDLRGVLAQTIRLQGYTVVEAADGVEGVTAAKAHFDLIITDFDMPGKNGLYVLKELRQERELKTPIIMFSGSPHLQEISLQTGATRFIEKPNGHALLDTIDELLSATVEPEPSTA